MWVGADTRSDASSPLIDAGGWNRSEGGERERGNGRLEIETLNEPAIIHGYGYNNVCTVLCPKACPCVCVAFSRAPRPRTARLHVHTRKKPAKLRYPFINPIKTIQNTAADLSLPTYATLNNGGVQHASPPPSPCISYRHA